MLRYAQHDSIHRNPCDKELVPLGLLLLHALGTAAAAQEARDTTRGKRWKTSAELSYTDQTGNRALRVLNGDIKATHLRKDLFRLNASAQSRYGESDGGVVARNHFGSLAVDLDPRAVVSPFLFVDAEHDRFKRLDARNCSGAGARYTPYRPARTSGEVSISLAMLLQYESRIAAREDPRPPSGTLARASPCLRGSKELPSGVRLQHLWFYQPAVDRLADYLLRTENGVRVALNRRLALSVIHQFNRTALPPEGVEPGDRIMRTGTIFYL
jgi:hypothetical protein